MGYRNKTIHPCEVTCVGISVTERNNLMKGKRKVSNRIVTKKLVKLGYIESFWADCYNPYNAYVTKTHLIWIHSGIEHFFPIS